MQVILNHKTYHSVKAAAKLYGIPYSTLRSRIEHYGTDSALIFAQYRITKLDVQIDGQAEKQLKKINRTGWLGSKIDIEAQLAGKDGED